jgi:hypothetical protein
MAPTRIAEYGAVCKIASRINHRCVLLLHQGVANTLAAVCPMCYATASSALSLCSSMRYVTSRQENSYFPPTAHSPKPFTTTSRTRAYGFICKCPACVNATPETDRLRTTFETKSIVLRWQSRRKYPSKINPKLLENALTLEKAMLKEGLDADFKFGTLLQVICLAFAHLGKGQGKPNISCACVRNSDIP